MSARARPARRGPCFVARATAAFILIGLSAPAVAEVGAAVSVFSEARWRGTALSEGDPVAQLDLSYDGPDGFYANLSGSLVAHSEYGIKPLALQENLGFAKRLKGGPTIDLGVVNVNYSRYTDYNRSTGHTEVYVGLVGKMFSSHIYLSPNHLHPGDWTAYGELDAGIYAARKLRLSAHVGAMLPLSSSYWLRTQYDWQIGATREVGPMSFHLTYSDGGPGRDYYEHRWHSRRALVAGATYIF